MRRKEKVVIIEGKNKFALRFFSEDETKPLMFCFPFIGGTSTAFRMLSQTISHLVNIVSVDPPGHGVVNGELVCDMDKLVEIYYQGILKYTDKDFYILGHSLGGIIGYLLAVKLEKAGIAPKGIFISASTSPNNISKEIESTGIFETKEGIRDGLIELGGKYEQLGKSNSIFFYSYMKVIKADYSLLKSFKETEELSLKCPSHIIFSHDDDMVEPGYMEDWKNYCKICELVKVNGNHNYIVNNSQEVGDVIASRL